jgi:hypothetical protein
MDRYEIVLYVSNKSNSFRIISFPSIEMWKTNYLFRNSDAGTQQANVLLQKMGK